ncbi:MAG: methionyl-tRNA formyltransferase [Candidatus Marinimicrobia bacterium]|nr:methionyl-tRNA formyltransferase [Candidatus Neomarinimicrobiota bacterium]
MKIIYMGTPEFAVPGLRAIAESGHEVTLVVTGPDKPAGRNRNLHETPVKQLALELNLPILQPASLKDPHFIDDIRRLNADIMVVVAFRILPDELINAARLGAINLHASLLPKYRGAAPINWALINGDKQTGITIFQIRPKVDTGDIIFQQAVEIAEQDTYGGLYTRLSNLGAPALVSVLNKLECGKVEAIPQDPSQVSLAPKIFPQMGEIDWSKSAMSLKNLIHGLSPIPGAYSVFGKKRIKFLRACYSLDDSSEMPATIVIRDKNHMGIQTGSGILYPQELQSEAKKALPVAEFLRGFPAKIGDRFQL